MFFFHRLAPAAGAPAPIDQDIVRKQLLSSLGDRVGIHARRFRNGAVTSPPEPERLEAGKEAPLLLVEETHEENDGGLGFVRIRRTSLRRSSLTPTCSSEASSETR